MDELREQRKTCDREQSVLALQETGTWDMSKFNVPDFLCFGSDTGLVTMLVPTSMGDAWALYVSDILVACICAPTSEYDMHDEEYVRPQLTSRTLLLKVCVWKLEENWAAVSLLHRWAGTSGWKMVTLGRLENGGIKNQLDSILAPNGS